LQVNKRSEPGFGWVKTMDDLREPPRVGLAKIKDRVH
jgi:hypothetical protein